MPDAQKVPSPSSSWPGRRKRRRAIAGFVDDKNARLVTYSNGRPGLFKKAAEACLLTGCSVAIVGFSPAGRPFSFSSQPTCSSSNDSLDSFLAGEIDAAAFAVPPPPPSEEITELALEVAELEGRVAAKKSAAPSSPTLEELRAAKRRVEARSVLPFLLGERAQERRPAASAVRRFLFLLKRRIPKSGKISICLMTTAAT